MIVTKAELLSKLDKIKQIYSSLTDMGITDYRIENGHSEIKRVRDELDAVKVSSHDPIFIDFEFATFMQDILEAYKETYKLYLNLVNNSQLLKKEAASNEFN